MPHSGKHFYLLTDASVMLAKDAATQLILPSLERPDLAAYSCFEQKYDRLNMAEKLIDTYHRLLEQQRRRLIPNKRV